MPGKHNAGGCGCCCDVCDDLYALNWLFGLCITYNNLGSPLSGSQDAANQSYVDNLNSVFGNVAVSWTSTTASAPGGIGGAWGVRYAAAVDYTPYTIYSCDTGRTTVYSTEVEATMINFGAWWSPLLPCNPYWFWQMTYYVKSPGANFRASRNLLHKRTTSQTSTSPDMSPTTAPFVTTHLLYPRSTTAQNWTADISQTTAQAGSCVNPFGDSAIEAELKTRYAPNSMTWPNSSGGLDTVLPIIDSGDLYYGNSSGTPLPPPTCGI